MMKDLNKYNQRLLAVLGTLVVTAIAIGLFMALYEFISHEIRKHRRAPREVQGVVIDQNKIVDTARYSFTQEISILEPLQLDSTKPVFLIPIGQKDQKLKRLNITEAGMGFSSEDYSDGEYYYSSFSGLYNNFVLIDYIRNIRFPVFKSKVAITEWAYMKINNSRLILFKGTDKDLNKDGRLNDDDFQSLFVFDTESLKTKELSFDNQTVLGFEPLSKTSKIYVRTGRDTDHNNYFNYSKEPSDLYFYDVETGESETLVPDSIKLNIQKILNK